MKNPGILKKIISYFYGITLKKYISSYSGILYIMLENGKKVLNTDRVNYSYNSLHRVFKIAFKKSNLQVTKIKNTLILGLGGGSIVAILRNNFKLNGPITAIEIDPVIIEIARKEFGIDQYAPLEIIQVEALEFMKINTRHFDLICVDLFINEKVPERFLSTGFLQLLIQILEPGGSIYFNVMLPDLQYQLMFNELFNFFSSQKKEMQIDINYLEIEENNRILIVKK